jgi:hypothetical protein
MINLVTSDRVNMHVKKILSLANLSIDDVELILTLWLPIQIQNGLNQRDLFSNDYRLNCKKILIFLNNCKFIIMTYDDLNLEFADNLNSRFEVNSYIFEISKIKNISIHSNNRDHEIDSIKLELDFSIRNFYEAFTSGSEESYNTTLEQRVIYFERLIKDNSYNKEDYSEDVIAIIKSLAKKCGN